MRQKNILLHSIPECQLTNIEEWKAYDHASFQNVVAPLFEEEGEATSMDAVSVIRLGKKQEGLESTKHRLMMIKLKDRETVDKLMARRTWLHKVGFSNIYLTRDLPMEERLEQKKQREELREELKRKGPVMTGQRSNFWKFHDFFCFMSPYLQNY